VRRGVAAGILVVGWTFIVWSNHFHATAPTVIVMLAYLAAIALVYNLWRVGAAAAEIDDGMWGQPVGAADELAREKKALLKAIKEAEFDRAMGKLSQADSDAMIRMYRARAIEVIKELDRIAGGDSANVRERIEREVKARLEVDKGKKKESKKEKGLGPRASGLGQKEKDKEAAS
jgi:hypothetical protein